MFVIAYVNIYEVMQTLNIIFKEHSTDHGQWLKPEIPAQHQGQSNPSYTTNAQNWSVKHFDIYGKILWQTRCCLSFTLRKFPVSGNNNNILRFIYAKSEYPVNIPSHM